MRSDTLRSSSHAIMMILAAVTAPAHALEGFPAALQALHPELEVTCSTCHNLSEGGGPSNLNVRPEGHAYYDELMEHERSRNTAMQGLGDKLQRVDFAVLGDTRTQDDIHREVVRQICADNPGLAVHTGDMVANGGNSGQWRNARAIEACLIDSKKLVHACGNHEGDGCTQNVVRDALGNHEAYYKVEFGGLVFVVLDTNDISDEQVGWLRSLPAGPKYIPVYHHAPYPTISGHGSTRAIIERFEPEFRRLGVKVAFNGHNHGYDRSIANGIEFVTVGGGGAPLYPCGPNLPYTQFCMSDYSYARCAITDRKSVV